MGKNDDYIDDFLAYQEKQYLPETHHINKGKLPRTSRELLRRPGAALFLLIPAMLPWPFAAVSAFSRYAETGEAAELVNAVAESLLFLVMVLAVGNCIRKILVYKKAKRTRKHKKRR